MEASETYNINTNNIDYGQPEEFLVLLNNVKIKIDGTGTTSPSGWINSLHKIIRGKPLREFDELSSQNGGSTNNHIKLITEGLIGYFFPINPISKQKRAMKFAMSKP